MSKRSPLSDAYAPGGTGMPGWAVQESDPRSWLPQGATGDLPDINVWLALAFEEHPHHEAAKAYWISARTPAEPQRAVPLWFCRVTMLGFTRLAMQPKVVGKGALDMMGAWTRYRAFVARPGVGLRDEAPHTETALHAIASRGDLPARLWTDAYLAAFAQASGLRLVSFDKDFQGFALERLLVL